MQAIVLSKKDFREFDQLITLYTRDQGKIELLSRGIKKIVSKQAAYLLPFSFVEAEVVAGQEIDHLIRTQSIELFKNIRRDLRKSLLADYIVKLVDQLVVGGEKDERVFALLISVLNFIELTGALGESIVLSFIAKFLQLLGFIPVLDHCVGGSEKIEQINNQQKLYFSPSAGGIICEADRLQMKKNEILLSLNKSDIKNFSLLYIDWDQVNHVIVSQIIKDSLYQFLIYQTERKVPNWFEISKALA